MAFTPNQQLETGTEGQADWDTLVNGNSQILERGYHIRGSAGATVNSGQVVCVSSNGFILPMDARSLANVPHGVSYRSVASGEVAQFVSEGAISSMGVWSASLRIGQPVFVSPASLGFCVASFAGHGQPVGFATAANAIRVSPGNPNIFPELTTEVATVGPVLVGSYGDFSLSLANRGIAQSIKIISNSGNGYKVQFWSGSARVNSEMLYETLTHSTAIGSVDVNTIFFLDQAGFPWFNTDTASAALVFGRISVQSGSSVNTATFAVTAMVERFR